MHPCTLAVFGRAILLMGRSIPWGSEHWPGKHAAQMLTANKAEDDGQGCVNCGWGWGHDGSAFKIISIKVIEVSLGLPFL